MILVALRHGLRAAIVLLAPYISDRANNHLKERSGRRSSLVRGYRLVAMIVFVRVIVIVVMIMIVRVVVMPVGVPMLVRMVVVVLVMMQPLPRAGTARVFAEHQRLDGHRHRI
jgi:hypothetical protein